MNRAWDMMNGAWDVNKKRLCTFGKRKQTGRPKLLKYADEDYKRIFGLQEGCVTLKFGLGSPDRERVGLKFGQLVKTVD
jgi:hypothetical protein